MKNSTFYYEMSDWSVSKHKYPSKYIHAHTIGNRQPPWVVILHADRVWRQGPKGGVKIVKDRSDSYYRGYVTNDVELMKKFMWIKLKSTEFKL